MKSTLLPALLLSTLMSLMMSKAALAEEDLANHPSPYLRLHANDPVDWRTWKKSVLAAAQRDNRLIYLSIGYFSCHWCHVMQRESFQDTAVSQYLNQHFVPVKIDRELHPELDRRMLEFVRVIAGRAGWPLNVFLTPDGYPLSGFNYLPRDEFLQALQALNSEWSRRSAELGSTARAFYEQNSREEPEIVSFRGAEAAEQLLSRFISAVRDRADDMSGGFGDTSKFPSYPQLTALIRLLESGAVEDSEISDFVQLTLDNMLLLNLHDQVNGGFFRYTTDPDWQTPHYEKMLYDNAQMVLLYLQAHELWPQKGYDEVALSTLDFIQRELRDPDGGYFSSLSAVDVENVEGSAYLWSQRELNRALSSDELTALQNTGALRLATSDQTLVSGLHQLPEKLRKTIQNKLRQSASREMPADEKKLASWNALMLMALVQNESLRPGDTASLLTDQQYRFIREHFLKSGVVSRFAGNTELAETNLEDYAFLARALAEYGMLRNDRSIMELAGHLVHAAFRHFYQNGRWFRSTDNLLPINFGEWLVADSVMESPVSVLLQTILLLDTVNQDTSDQATLLVERVTTELRDNSFHHASFISFHYQQAGRNRD